MGKKSRKQSRHEEQSSSEQTVETVKLKAKANWQLRDQFVKAGETVRVDKDYADILLKQTRNFVLA